MREAGAATDALWQSLPLAEITVALLLRGPG
jgi:hypothetical protein